MAFVKKTWTDRMAEYINRRRLDFSDGTSKIATVAREEGTVVAEGDAFNAENMNDLEQRIADGLSPLDSMSAINSNTEEGKIAGALAVKELNNNLTSIENYSTDEKIVGKWVDGRNVYQKTYQGVMPTPTTMGSRFSYNKVLETFSGNVFPIASDGYFCDGACYTVGSSTSYQSSSFYDSCVASSNNILNFSVSTPYNTTITYAVTVKYLKES